VLLAGWKQPWGDPNGNEDGSSRWVLVATLLASCSCWIGESLVKLRAAVGWVRAAGGWVGWEQLAAGWSGCLREWR